MEKILQMFNKDIEYCLTNNIKKIIIFVQNANTLSSINNYLFEKQYDLKVIGVTFPANEVIYVENSEGEIEERIPETATDSVFENLNAEGITLIRSALPFEGIVIPGGNYNPYKIVAQTLDLVHDGLANIIQTAMIATDTGHINVGEEIVVSNLALYVHLEGVNSRMLFHPDFGLKIKKIEVKDKLK